MPKSSRTRVMAVLKLIETTVLPGNTSTATGLPCGQVSSPYSICLRPRLPSRECPNAARSQHFPPPTRKTSRTSRCRREKDAAPPAASRSRAAGKPASPSRHRHHRWRRPPREDPRPGWYRQIADERAVDSLDTAAPRGTGPAHRRCRVPGTAGPAGLPGPASMPSRARRRHSGAAPTARPRTRPPHPPGWRLSATASTSAIDLVGKVRQVRQRLVPDFALMAERAPQQHALIAPLLTRLAHIPARNPGHVHRTRTTAHTSDDSRNDTEYPLIRTSSLATLSARKAVCT